MLENKTIRYTDSKSLNEPQNYNLQVKHLLVTNKTMADLLSRCNLFQQKCSNLEKSPTANFLKPCLPDRLLKSICKDAHQQCHFSPYKMKLLIDNVGLMRKYVKFVRKFISNKPRNCYNLDICKLFHTNLSSTGNKHIILCVDSISRFWMVGPLKTMLTSEVSYTLIKEVIYRYG
uniref:Integrase catalytic domain-containing protein n=1 Tax=Strongyloides venezuelensis TaxID=75913 RepID=A0A0K0FJV7_STRVS